MKHAATSIYILSLQSEESRRVNTSKLNIIAKKMQGELKHQDIDWSKVDYISVLMLVDELKATLGTGTVNAYIAAIKGAAKAAWMCKQLDVEAYQHIKEVSLLKGGEVPRGKALTSTETKRLLNTCDGSPVSLRDSAILAVTYAAGLRRSEVAKLSLEDVDLETGSILIRGKRNKQAVNHITGKAISVLNKWVQVRGNKEGSLFPSIRKGGSVQENHMSGQSILDILKKRQKQAGLEGFTPHDLRSSFITHLLENNVDVFVVSSLARHSSIQTTQGYDKRSKGVAIDAARALSF